MTPFVAECLGTFLMILMGTGVVANVVLAKTKGHNAGWMVISTAWALGVFIGVVVAAPVSGAHLNPAVTFALALAGQFSWASVPSYVGAQLLGAALGAGTVRLAYRDHFDATDDSEQILSVFCTIPAIRRNFSNFMSEAIGTFALILLVFFIGCADCEVAGLGAVGALPISVTVWVIGLALGGPTGYAINPARDFAPRLMHWLMPFKHKGSSQWDYAWVPIFGPLFGAAMATLLFLWVS